MVFAEETQSVGVLDRMTAASGPGANLRFLGGAMVAGGAALAILPDVDVVLCPLRAVTGLPCPFCGMTTGTLALSRFDVGTSIAANPAAIVLVSAVLFAFLPRRVRERGSPLLRRAGMAAPVWLPWVLLGGLWVWQLDRFDLL